MITYVQHNQEVDLPITRFKELLKKDISDQISEDVVMVSATATIIYWNSEKGEGRELLNAFSAHLCFS